MLKKIDYHELSVNPMTMFAEQWMLLTAGNEAGGYNTMTISWGHMGAIWKNGGGLPTAVVYVRPQRYTKEFIDREELFTLSVVKPENKKDAAYLGSHSGRDEDKVAKTSLTPVFADGTTYFAEAEYVFVCKKLYHAPIKPEGFYDPSMSDKFYPEKDFHEMYVGEIIAVYKNQ